MQSIDESFQQLEQHNILFGFFYDTPNINKETPADILTDCKHFETSLTHNANKDIDADDLCNEIQVVARRFPKPMSPSDVHLYIVQQKLTVSLIILLTFPVSVARGERIFSKLKLIKTYLRLTMSQRSSLT